jgi:hypothetical protein
MTLAPTRAVLLGATVLGSLGPAVARAQEPTPEAPVATPAPTPAPAPAEAVPVAPPPVAPPPSSTPTPGPTPVPAEAATPGAAPAAAPFDWGGRAVEPLPPPPAAADPAKIRVDPWRGRFWLAPRILITGPIGGDKPARPTLLTLGGGVDFGVRINNRIGVGMGLSGQQHTSVRATIPGTVDKRIYYGNALFYDALFARFYFLKKRFQPLVEVGGGLARITMPQGERYFGPQMRLGAGFDGWITNQVTLGFTMVYRMIALKIPQDGITPSRWEVGHALQGALQLGLHW